MIKKLIITIIFIGLVSCATGPINKFYQPTGVIVDKSFQGDPIVLPSENLDNDFRHYTNEGYQLIGTCAFVGNSPTIEQLKSKAKRVNARVVLFNQKHIGDAVGFTSFTTPNPPQMLSSTTNGSILGYGGYALYTGTTNTMVPGGYTTNLAPYSISRYETRLSFFGK